MKTSYNTNSYLQTYLKATLVILFQFNTEQINMGKDVFYLNTLFYGDIVLFCIVRLPSIGLAVVGSWALIPNGVIHVLIVYLVYE